MRHRYTAQNGFTLIEMMITVAVIAVLLAITVPSFNDFFDKNRLKHAAEDIYGLLAKAKAETVTRDRDLSFAITAGDPWCVGYAEAPGCDCTNAASCTVPVGPVGAVINVTQIVDSTTHPDVSLGGAYAGGTYDRIDGSVAAGTINLTAGQWALNVIVSTQGRVRICAPGGNKSMGYEAC